MVYKMFLSWLVERARCIFSCKILNSYIFSLEYNKTALNEQYYV